MRACSNVKRLSMARRQLTMSFDFTKTRGMRYRHVSSRLLKKPLDHLEKREQAGIRAGPKPVRSAAKTSFSATC